ncbi:MAG: hypothetical protein SVR94_07565 [Pseudomonadota bacterium]|nr:hypothetical protein [Pseudomonadota bacterium]
MVNKAIVKSGPIWMLMPRRRAQIIRRVCESLKVEYGLDRLGNPEIPVDDLVFIILTNKTSPMMAKKLYQTLKKQYPSWEDLLDSSRADVQKIIQQGGLSMVKSNQIYSALFSIREKFGSCQLNSLQDESSDQIHKYLVSLPGVSDKVAKCVMLFTFNRAVLPVDNHVFRITKRLGWNQRKRADQCHEELEALIKPKYRYAFHVDCIMHGRQVCLPRHPFCNKCCVSHNCMYNSTKEN